MYGEDVLLGWRLGAERMAYVPHLLVSHETSASSRNGSLFYETRVVSGHWLLAYKLARSRTDLLLLLAARWLSLGVRSLLRSVRSHSSTPLLALWRGSREIAIRTNNASG